MPQARSTLFCSAAAFSRKICGFSPLPTASIWDAGVVDVVNDGREMNREHGPLQAKQLRQSPTGSTMSTIWRYGCLSKFLPFASYGIPDEVIHQIRTILVRADYSCAGTEIGHDLDIALALLFWQEPTIIARGRRLDYDLDTYCSTVLVRADNEEINVVSDSA
eukprot:scaffold1787_cov165-Cylindrotheca_fusiformis.AAC.2